MRALRRLVSTRSGLYSMPRERRAEPLRRGDHDLAVARAEVDDEIVRRHAREEQHPVDRGVGRRHPDDVLAVDDRLLVEDLELRRRGARHENEPQDGEEPGAHRRHFRGDRTGRSRRSEYCVGRRRAPDLPHARDPAGRPRIEFVVMMRPAPVAGSRETERRTTWQQAQTGARRPGSTSGSARPTDSGGPVAACGSAPRLPLERHPADVQHVHLCRPSRRGRAARAGFRAGQGLRGSPRSRSPSARCRAARPGPGAVVKTALDLPRWSVRTTSRPRTC